MTDSTPIATEAIRVAAYLGKPSVTEDSTWEYEIHPTQIVALCDRLTQSEAALEAEKRESEWRGLLWMALENGWATRWIDADGGYLALMQVNDEGFPCGMSFRLSSDDIPSRPTDAVVQQIKEAIR